MALFPVRYEWLFLTNPMKDNIPPYLISTLFFSIWKRNSRDTRCQMSTIDFNQLTALMEDTTLILLDVRNVNELEEQGRIPGSVNIPLPEISVAFRMSREEFRQKYGFDLPDKETESLVITCRLQSSKRKE